MAAPPKRATLDDLMNHDGKAELINGRIVEFMSVGVRPSCIPDNIIEALRPYVRRTRRGICRSDGLGYTVPMLTSGRESFQPDVSYYEGPMPGNEMRFVAGAPNFAVEVRSENDYGPAAERDMAAKRDDYFEAGTLVVWDVCPLTEEVRKYTPGQTTPTVFRISMVADAEPAVPGWQVSVDAVFERL